MEAGATKCDKLTSNGSLHLASRQQMVRLRNASLPLSVRTLHLSNVQKTTCLTAPRYGDGLWWSRNLLVPP